MSKPIIFSAENGHDPSCGAAPAWTTAPRTPGEGRHFFENAYGEQWIASTTKTCLRVTSGEIDWETIEIVNPDYAMLAKQAATASIVGGFFPGIGTFTLSLDECFWLMSVCASASRPAANALREGRGRLPLLNQEEVSRITAPIADQLRKLQSEKPS